MDELLAFDAQHLWHPYGPSAAAPVPAGAGPRLVTGASGVRLDVVGHGDVIDGMSSWWAAIHGYRHPALDAAATAQLASMSHVMFGGLTHAPAVELGRRLVELTGYDQIFFCDSGSVSVEVAVKICLQRALGVGRGGRTRMLTIRGGYHGDTFTPMSLCDPDGGMHSMWRGVLPEHVFAELPPAWDGNENVPDDDPAVLAWAAGVRALAAAHAHELAGVIVEPVLQGAGGMRMYPPACLRVLRAVADELDVPLVLDEIATGFGRTGTLFGADHAPVRADVVCVGKALTGGYLTLAAVLCTAEVAAAVDASPAGGLAHGPTFMANPLACAVAAANLDLLLAGDWRADVARIETGLRAGLSALTGAPGVADVRVLGAVGVVQLERPVDVPLATDVALDHGVWLRPFRDLIYTMPPYPCTEDEVDTITGAIAAAVRKVAA
ncbi:adenosylmethionine--8-amino-7-oxononanoate transaminase [Spongisporangium articulatum]|uniref:Adenosylmethionine-8-amino-7-oxononanoate aminotransferase n=1 Tax=Spongisporangium articulatum TaxID=3362603 RepID=A0ABW8AMB9_9ACTN